uniref:Uncharacterized protein n=1 Tax=Knipowitschia caucasica TaxID=637954 RepID=A0AAV2L5Z2_KNICA
MHSIQTSFTLRSQSHQSRSNKLSALSSSSHLPTSSLTLPPRSSRSSPQKLILIVYRRPSIVSSRSSQATPHLHRPQFRESHRDSLPKSILRSRSMSSLQNLLSFTYPRRHPLRSETLLISSPLMSTLRATLHLLSPHLGRLIITRLTNRRTLAPLPTISPSSPNYISSIDVISFSVSSLPSATVTSDPTTNLSPSAFVLLHLTRVMSGVAGAFLPHHFFSRITIKDPVIPLSLYTIFSPFKSPKALTDLLGNSLSRKHVDNSVTQSKISLPIPVFISFSSSHSSFLTRIQHRLHQTLFTLSTGSPRNHKLPMKDHLSLNRASHANLHGSSIYSPPHDAMSYSTGLISSFLTPSPYHHSPHRKSILITTESLLPFNRNPPHHYRQVQSYTLSRISLPRSTFSSSCLTRIFSPGPTYPRLSTPSLQDSLPSPPSRRPYRYTSSLSYETFI